MFGQRATTASGASRCHYEYETSDYFSHCGTKWSWLRTGDPSPMVTRSTTNRFERPSLEQQQYQFHQTNQCEYEFECEKVAFNHDRGQWRSKWSFIDFISVCFSCKYFICRFVYAVEGEKRKRSSPLYLLDFLSTRRYTYVISLSIKILHCT